MLQISYNTGILLTSHSMEECDALCTRLGIMVAGTFRCFGTPQHLKTRWSQGYAMLLKLHTVDTIPIVQQAVQHVFPGAMLNEVHDRTLMYTIPAVVGIQWSSLFGALESLMQDEQLQIEDYSLTQSTLEQVFLAFSRV